MNEKEKLELKERIYELMNGLWDLDTYPVKESQFVEDEFGEGKMCAIAYREVMEANMRLCERLSCEKEDSDVEIILHNLMKICHHLCMKMFDYGELYAGHYYSRLRRS